MTTTTMILQHGHKLLSHAKLGVQSQNRGCYSISATAPQSSSLEPPLVIALHFVHVTSNVWHFLLDFDTVV